MASPGARLHSSSDEDDDAHAYGHHDSQDELDFEGSPGPKRGRSARRDSVASTSAGPHTVACEWVGCREAFWELEPLIDHLTTVHAFPSTATGQTNSKKAGGSIWLCHWSGCTKAGKNQGGRGSLLGHFRTHTGEKPFDCPRPECDKCFTRPDALQKHMRILHGEIIVTSKQTSAASVATASGKAKKRKLSAKETRELRALSSDSESGPPHSDDIDSLPPVLDEWTPEQEELAGQFPEHEKAWLAHLVELAKWKVGIREHEELVNELEVVLLRERELKDTNELLLRGIMRQELPADPALTTYLDSFNHVPTTLPFGWTATDDPHAPKFTLTGRSRRA